ncbi:MAG: excinuclease ABC subunit C, partial [Tenericutes bacterium]|nr:excinuclease ABC subunit C [Mycoplasmatota bacterium]
DKLKTMTNEIISFLKGNNKIITDKINFEIKKASKNLNFERALELKNMLTDIEITLTKQKVALNRQINYDIFGYYATLNYLSITVFNIREGLLFGSYNYNINTLDIVEDLLQFIIHYYENNHILPKEIILNDILDNNLLSEYLKIKVSTPKRGIVKQLLNMANENAEIAFQNKEAQLNKSIKEKEKALQELKELLKVDKVSRIEAFDNSHLFGTFYVAGMVVFDQFEPLKKEYRKYKLDMSIKDDLSAMKEVVYRRYYRALLEGFERPDIIIVDGGTLQVKAAKEILDSLNLDIKIIGLKKNQKHHTNTIINDNLEEIKLNNHSHLFLMLSKIQEEVHEYTINYHRHIKRKGSLASLIDLVPGIGPKKRQLLLKKFGSLKQMQEASLKELEAVIDKKTANNLFVYLRNL